MLFQRTEQEIIASNASNNNSCSTCKEINAARLLSLFLLSHTLTLKVVVVVLLFYVHGKHLRSCRDGQLT